MTPSGGGASTTVAVSSDGSFSVNIQQPVSYDVVAPAPGFLSAVKLGVVVSGAPIVLPAVELRAGLVDGDNVVSIRDVSAAAASFGLSVSDRTDGSGRFVDVNGDGVVNILDISAIASNFGAVSPLAWP